MPGPGGTGEPGYVTGIAEIRRELLPDGTVVTLGAASAMDLRFTPGERRVLLSAGEAYFEVEENPAAPFVVEAGGTLVRVLGTKFDVSLGVGAVNVAVSEGRVEVIQPETPTAEIADGDIKHVLTAGQRVTAASTGPVQPVVTVEADKVAAWRRGELVWENTALRDIVADLNRYSARQVRFASDDIGDAHYTFAFQASDIEEAVDVIADTLGLKAEETGDGTVVLR